MFAKRHFDRAYFKYNQKSSSMNDLPGKKLKFLTYKMPDKDNKNQN